MLENLKELVRLYPTYVRIYSSYCNHHTVTETLFGWLLRKGYECGLSYLLDHYIDLNNYHTTIGFDHRLPYDQRKLRLRARWRSEQAIVKAFASIVQKIFRFVLKIYS